MDCDTRDRIKNTKTRYVVHNGRLPLPPQGRAKGFYVAAQPRATSLATLPLDATLFGGPPCAWRGEVSRACAGPA